MADTGVGTTIVIDTAGLDEKLNRFPILFHGIRERILVEVGMALEGEMKREAPVGKTAGERGYKKADYRPGRLRTSIKAVPDYPNNKVVVGATVDYAQYVVNATRASPGRYVPAIGKRLVNPGQRNFGTHPGTKADDFVKRAKDSVEPKVQTIAMGEITRGLEGMK